MQRNKEKTYQYEQKLKKKLEFLMSYFEIEMVFL